MPTNERKEPQPVAQDSDRVEETCRSRKVPQPDSDRERSVEVLVGRHELDARITAIAAQRRNVVSFADLLGVGLTESSISRRVSAGRLFVIHRGVYAITPRKTLEAKALNEAAVMALGDGARLMSHSSAAVWKFRPDLEHDDDRHVGVPVRGRRNRDGIVVRYVPDDPINHAFRDGIAITSAARTLLDIAPDLTLTELKDAIREAIRLKCVIYPQLHAIIDEYPRHPGRAKLAAALDYRETGQRESKLEDRAWDFFVEAGLPLPECNVKVRARRVDFLWRDQRLIVECDSREFHDDDDDAFETDRERDIEHLVDGHVTVRITHRKLTRGRLKLAAQLSRLLAARTPG